MKAIIRGVQVVNYIKKTTNERVQGVTLFLNTRGADVIGYKNIEEFISSTTQVYQSSIAPFLGSDINKLIDAEVEVDYDITRRGSQTFSRIIDLSFVGGAK